jgi:glutamate racemase
MTNKLGIIDWGIGGISIYRLVKEHQPDLSVVYFSDTGTTPYGKMERKELAARLDVVNDFLKEKGVTHLIIGCNAASTAIADLADHGIKIEGVIEAAVQVALRSKPTRLGLIGGRRTVVSGIYRRAFAAQGIRLEQRVAQPLSGLIESGDVSSDKLRFEAKRILSPLKESSHVLLACTHYPAIENVLREFVSGGTRFIDPAKAVAERVAKWKLEPGGGGDRFYTTGDAEQMKSSARLAFGVKIPKVNKIKI